MTVSAWLETRTPAPPPDLAARIHGALGDGTSRDAVDAPDVLTDAADQLLRDLLSRPSDGRDSALDLLTVDALVTYAFEAASTDPHSLAGRASAAMRRFADAVQS